MYNKIFLLYSCDEDNRIQADSLMLVTSSFKTISEVIISNILNDTMSYYDKKMEIKEQAKMFIDDYVENDIDLIDNRLFYGYCCEVYDGVVIQRT